MKGRLRFYLAGALLIALAGCGRGLWPSGERDAWRHDAEVSCMKSGAVKLGAGVVQIEPIEGPGICGMDFPLKVSQLAENGTAMTYADDLRPPAAIPNAGSNQMPRWPVDRPRYTPVPVEPVQTAPVQSRPIQAPPVRGEVLRWVPGPQGIERPQASAPAQQPMSLDPPGFQQDVAPSEAAYPEQPRAAPLPSDIPDDAVLPAGRRRAPDYAPVRPAYPSAPRTYNAPTYQPPQRQYSPPPLGPPRAPQQVAAAELSPPATLACPLVSALDRWVSEGVQPAALYWFGQPVTKIQQIGSYSCREMVGSGTSHISEHAFGNALDVAGFTLADGHKITVKKGWHGSPEEQGFLHDVQLYACKTFVTVLAPGYNPEHYDHIHVDLMHRRPGYRPCRPEAIPGDVVASKARAHYAARHRGPAYTGSIAAFLATGKVPTAVPGADGYVPDDGEEPATTGSISKTPEKADQAKAGGDVADAKTADVPKRHHRRLTSSRDAAIRAMERKPNSY